MARPPQYNTVMVEEFRCSIDLAWLRRTGARMGMKGRIRWHHRGLEMACVDYSWESPGLWLIYKRADRWKPVTELIPIASTPATLGGYRHWFLCPGCKRHCRIVYRADRFRCRLCLGAKYESQYESEPMRICNRRWRIRKQLEDRGGARPGPLGWTMAFRPSRRACTGRPIGACRPWTRTWPIAGASASWPGWIVQIFATSSPVLSTAS
jgi:hypothetical protein